MIESDFSRQIGSKSVGFFQRQFELGVEAFDDAAGELLLRLEIVEQQAAVTLESGCHFLERIKPAVSDSNTPRVEELSGPSRRIVGPEMLEALGQQEGSDAAQAA